MTDRCGVCGGELDDLAVRVTLQFAPGRRGPQTFSEVPWLLEDWPVCWSCLSGESGLALRKALVDEYMEPLIVRPPSGCAAVCAGGHRLGEGRRARWRRFFSVRQGSIGVLPLVKCPVCLGPANASLAEYESAYK